MTLQHLCCQERFSQLTANITVDQVMNYFDVSHKERSFHFATRRSCSYITVNEAGSSLSQCRVTHNQHRPIPLNFKIASHPVMVILREPTARLVSAFVDGFHHEGMNHHDFLKLKAKMLNGNGDNFLSRLSSNASLRYAEHAIKLYSEEPVMIGCQTKMILGYDCADSDYILPLPLNQTILQQAINKLNSFSFIGLFEEYSKSIELFHITAGKGTVPSPVEIARTRLTDHNITKIISSFLWNYTDPYDHLLYAVGRKIFYKRYKEKFNMI